LRPSQKDDDTAHFIPPHGGYQELLSYQKALVVFQATLYFCGRFIDKKSRTHDQMVQAEKHQIFHLSRTLSRRTWPSGTRPVGGSSRTRICQLGRYDISERLKEASWRAT
jgi:hypothetical protein